MTLIFITFGSHNNFIDAGNRLIMQANSLNIFDKIILYTGEDLKKDDIFWKEHQNFIEKNKRGYGYWLWKPYLIKKTIEQMKDGDILLYLDCGCEIDIREKDFLLKCLDTVKKNKIITTKTCIEEEWNKMDLIEKLDMKHDKYLKTSQCAPGASLFLVCKETCDLINEWYELGRNYHNIDDTPSISKNLDCFKEHRHDQSIFSLLMKKHNLYRNNSLRDKCIKTLRNKTGVSNIK